MTKKPGGHLRLIITEKSHSTAPELLHHGHQQLSLPYPETSSVLLVLLEAIGKNEFSQILEEFAPNWIIDVRAVPRLDKIAVSRLSAFTLFEKFHTSYVDLFGRLGIKSYRAAESNPAFWSGAVIELLKNSNQKGPYFFLFDNEELLSATCKVLPSFIEPLIGKTPRFAQIRHAEMEQLSRSD